MGNTLTITDAEFDKQVLQAEGPVLVDFWAEWCGPCRMLGPVVEEIAEEHSDVLTVGKMDIDSQQAKPADFGVQSIPTLILFKDGQEAERLVGFMPKERIMAKLKPHLATATA